MYRSVDFEVQQQLFQRRPVALVPHGMWGAWSSVGAATLILIWLCLDPVEKMEKESHETKG